MPIEARLASGTPAPARDYDADIIILAINRRAETTDAIASALRQTDVDFHLTIVDQGSDDATSAAFAGMIAGLSNAAFYITPHNLGVAGGRNLLSALGHGRIIVSLDNDAVFADNTVVSRAVASFAQTPQLGALGFKILDRGGNALDQSSWGYPAALKPRCEERFDATTFVGAGHAIRRAAWTAAGGYDERFFFTWEEHDFCLRAIALGWLVRYDGTLGVNHAVAAGERVKWSAARTMLFVRNRLILARKWNATWASLLPRIAGYIVQGVLHRRVAPTLRGVVAAIRADATLKKHAMPAAMRDYLVRNDLRHRGSFGVRLRTEVFGVGRADL